MADIIEVTVETKIEKKQAERTLIILKKQLENWDNIKAQQKQELINKIADLQKAVDKVKQVVIEEEKPVVIENPT